MQDIEAGVKSWTSQALAASDSDATTLASAQPTACIAHRLPQSYGSGLRTVCLGQPYPPTPAGAALRLFVPLPSHPWRCLRDTSSLPGLAAFYDILYDDPAGPMHSAGTFQAAKPLNLALNTVGHRFDVTCLSHIVCNHVPSCDCRQMPAGLLGSQYANNGIVDSREFISAPRRAFVGHTS